MPLAKIDIACRRSLGQRLRSILYVEICREQDKWRTIAVPTRGTIGLDSGIVSNSFGFSIFEADYP